MRSSVSAHRDDFSLEHAFAVTANWKRDQASTIVGDALTHGCRYAPPPAVTIRFRTVVLLFSRKTAESLEANELQHAGDLPTMAILSRTNSKLDDSVIFRRIPVHARGRKSNGNRDKLSRCKNCWNNAFDIWSDTYCEVRRDDWRFDSGYRELTVIIINRVLSRILQMHFKNNMEECCWRSRNSIHRCSYANNALVRSIHESRVI